MNEMMKPMMPTPETAPAPEAEVVHTIENPSQRSLGEGISEVEAGEPALTPEAAYAAAESRDGVSRADFIKVELVTNSSGVLVQVNFQLKPEAVARKGFRTPTGYEVLAKTKPGTRSGSTTTKLDRIDYDANGDVTWSETIAELQQGEWIKKG